MSRRPHLTGRGQVFLGLGTVVVLIGTLFGYPDITRAGVLVLCLPVLAVVVGWRPAPPMTVHRHIHPPLLAPGYRAQVELSFRGRGSRLSALQVAEERLEPALGAGPRFLLPRMDPGERHVVTYRVSSATRGAHTLGPVRLERRDPFGLTTASVALPGTAEIVVLPRIEPLGPDRVRGGGLGREGQVPHMVALHGEDDVSIRAYRDGDSLRRVHWPTTARRGELMVRQEDRPARRRAVLLLDTRKDAYRGRPEAFEWAVRALASVTVHLAEDGYAVHVVGAGDAHATDVRAILRALALVTPSTTQLPTLVRDVHALTSEGAVVVAVVADHEPEAVLTVPAARSPGSLGVAFVLDTSPASPAGNLTSLFASAGWRPVAVTPDDDIAETWATATNGTAARRSGLVVRS